MSVEILKTSLKEGDSSKSHYILRDGRWDAFETGPNSEDMFEPTDALVIVALKDELGCAGAKIYRMHSDYIQGDRRLALSESAFKDKDTYLVWDVLAGDNPKHSTYVLYDEDCEEKERIEVIAPEHPLRSGLYKEEKGA